MREFKFSSLTYSADHPDPGHLFIRHIKVQTTRIPGQEQMDSFGRRGGRGGGSYEISSRSRRLMASAGCP